MEYDAPKENLDPELIERLMEKDEGFMVKLDMVKGDIIDNLGIYSKSLADAKGVLPEEGDELEEITTIKGEMLESWKKLAESLEENSTSSVDALKNVNDTIVGYGETLRKKLDVDVLGKLEGLSNGFSDSLKSMKGINTHIKDYGSKLKEKLEKNMKDALKPPVVKKPLKDKTKTKSKDKDKDKDKDKGKGVEKGPKKLTKGVVGKTFVDSMKGDSLKTAMKGPSKSMQGAVGGAKGLAKNVMGKALSPVGMEWPSDGVKDGVMGGAEKKGGKKKVGGIAPDDSNKESIVKKDAQVVVIEKFEKDALEGLSGAFKGSGGSEDDDALKSKKGEKPLVSPKAKGGVETAIKGAMVAAIAGFTVGKVLDEKFGISDKVGDLAGRVADKKLDKQWVKDYLPDLKARWPGATVKFEDMGGEDIRNPSEKRKMWDQAFHMFKKEKEFKDNKAVEDAKTRSEAKAKAEKEGTKFVDPIKKEKWVPTDTDGDGTIDDKEWMRFQARKKARQSQQKAVERAAEGNKPKIDANKGAEASADKTEEAVNGTNVILKESAEETAKNQKKAEAQQEEVIDLLRKVADKDQSGGGGGGSQMDMGAMREASTDHAYNGRSNYTDR